jgi:hypothetical protein
MTSFIGNVWVMEPVKLNQQKNPQSSLVDSLLMAEFILVSVSFSNWGLVTKN